MKMAKPVFRISVRNLVEFILRSGDIDNRHSVSDKEAMQKGSRIHRKIQKRMGAGYQAEVSLKWKTEYEDLIILVEGRADGIFTKDDITVIDEIKGSHQIRSSWKHRFWFIRPRQCVMPGCMGRWNLWIRLISR